MFSVLQNTKEGKAMPSSIKSLLCCNFNNTYPCFRYIGWLSHYIWSIQYSGWPYCYVHTWPNVLTSLGRGHSSKSNIKYLTSIFSPLFLIIFPIRFGIDRYKILIQSSGFPRCPIHYVPRQMRYEYYFGVAEVCSSVGASNFQWYLCQDFGQANHSSNTILQLIVLNDTDSMYRDVVVLECIPVSSLLRTRASYWK